MKNGILTLMLALIFSVSIVSQTNTFTYQGKLTDGSVAANGTYQMQFSLFDLVSGGSQIGTTITLDSVNVTAGVFTVELNFTDADAFDGSPRWLQIAVKRPADPGFTPLSPRQPFTSAPYSIKSLNSDTAEIAVNSTQLGGITASQFVITTDPRMADARPPLAESADYIQNRTTQQALSNFNVSGDGIVGGSMTVGNSLSVGNAGQFSGNLSANTLAITSTLTAGNTTLGNLSAQQINAASGLVVNGPANVSATLNANIVNAATQYNIDGVRILRASGSNTFVGRQAGNANPTGGSNSFFGDDAGMMVSSGIQNSLFGAGAGRDITAGISNSFFGVVAGSAHASGNGNSFFGALTGTGTSAVSGDLNSFFGAQSGFNRTSGNENSLFGALAMATDGISNSSAIGARAIVGTSNSVVLGAIAGQNGATSGVRVGIGLPNPTFKLHVIDESNTGLRVQTNTTGGTVASFGGNGAFQIDAPGIVGGRMTVLETGNVGIGTNLPLTRLHVAGTITTSLSGGGGGSVCHTNIGGVGTLSVCGSSIRYKTNVNAFSSGRVLIDRLRPVTFNWKADGKADLGLVAEEVAEIEPLLATYNDKGEVEGVKYDRIGVVLINVVKEQQAEIISLKEQLQELRRAICETNPGAKICEEPK